MASSRLFLIDQGLITLGGHHAEYNFSIAQAARARGLDPVLIVNQKYEPVEETDFPIYPIFTYAWHNLRRVSEPVWGDPASRPPAYLFQSELATALCHFDAGPDDHVFIHSVGFLEAEELLAFFLERPLAELPYFHFLLRRDIDEINGNPHAYQAFLRSIGRMRDLGVIPRGLSLYTDTPELTESYASETGVTFRTLPIPFRHELIDEAKSRVDARATTRDVRPSLLYLGDARTEKGYHLLPGLARGLAPSASVEPRARIVAQSNFNSPEGEPKPRVARNQLMALPSDRVELHTKALNPNRYYDLLCSSDVVLIPYDRACYARRSSGIFTEALAAGKPVVIPSGTSMANALPEGAGVVYDSEARFVEACFEALDRLPELTRQAAAAAATWRTQHSPDALVRDLLDSAVRGRGTDPASAPLVLVILDGESLYYKIGSGESMVSQLRFLQRSGYRVAVLALVHHDLPDSDGERSTRVWLDRCNRATDGLGVAGCWVASYATPPDSSKIGFDHDLARRSNLVIPEGVRAFLRTHTPDCVFLNYAQNMPALWKLGIPEVPVVCEAHDLQAFQYAITRDKPVDEAELARELSLYERVASAIFVNDLETRRAMELAPRVHAVTTTPVSYDAPLSPRDLAGPVDVAEILSSCGSELDDVDIERAWRTGRLDQFHRAVHEEGIDLLFVGAHHTPNRLALEWFFHQVFVPHLAPRGVNLVVGGTISTQREFFVHPRVYWTGKVGTLRPLYAAAKVVILPITEGAGFNMKTMQALGMGKPVVTTSLALRGIGGDVTHIAACDDPESFARRVLDLVRSASVRTAASEASIAASRGLRDHAAHDAQRRASLRPALGAKTLPLPAALPAPMIEHLEWTAEIRSINEAIRHLVLRKPIPAALLARYERIVATPAGSTLQRTIVSSLLVERDAPILRTAQDAFASIRAWRAAANVHEGFAALCLQAIDPGAYAPRARNEAFAGCQTLAEVLSACGSDRVDVDLDRAWKSHSLDQIARLEQAEALHLVAITDESGTSRAGLERFYRDVYLASLAPAGINLTIVGPLERDAFNHPLVFVAGTIANPWPLISAAKVLVVPFDASTRMNPRAVTLSASLLTTGKPLLGDAGVFWYLPDEIRQPLACDSAGMMARRVRQLLASPETRRLQGEATTRALTHIHTLLTHIRGGRSPSLLELAPNDEDPSPCEWSPEDAILGRLVHKSILRSPVLDAEIKTLKTAMTNAESRARWERSLRSLFAEGTAPIVASGHATFARPAPACRTLEQFLGVLEPLRELRGEHH